MSLLRLECRRLAVSPLPWVLFALVLALLAWVFLQALNGFLLAQARLAALPSAPGFTDIVAVPLLSQLAQISLLLAPLLLMSSLAGERRQGTLRVLLASGQSPLAIVLAKFLVGWGWLLLLLAATLAMPLALAGGTALDWGKLAAATLGIGLFLGSLAAISIACSAWTRHAALAGGVAVLLSLGLWLVNTRLRAAGDRGGLLDWIALPTHLQPLMRGFASSADIAWFLLLIATALAIAVLRVGHERVAD